MRSFLRQRRTLALAVGCIVCVGALWRPTSAREQGQIVEVTVNGDHYAFAPARIEVHKDDVVKVTFHARDIAHSFTVDAYRIAKRAASGQTVVFEFRADQQGTFPYYCSLTQDSRCREMKGQIVVK